MSLSLSEIEIQTDKPYSIQSSTAQSYKLRSGLKKTKEKTAMSTRIYDDKNDTVTIRAASRDEEGRKKVEKLELEAHKIDTVKYIERKLADKGVQRMERHPADGLPFGRPPPKSGHGGKYTWEGPADEAENELEPVPPAIDEGDPNYVDEEAEDAVVEGEEELMVGEVEVAKAAEVKEGVARIDVDPHLKV